MQGEGGSLFTPQGKLNPGVKVDGKKFEGDEADALKLVAGVFGVPTDQLLPAYKLFDKVKTAYQDTNALGLLIWGANMKDDMTLEKAGLNKEQGIQRTDVRENDQAHSVKLVLANQKLINKDQIAAQVAGAMANTKIAVLEINAHAYPHGLGEFGMVANNNKEMAKDLGQRLRALDWKNDGFIILSACNTGNLKGNDTWVQVLANASGRTVYAPLGFSDGSYLGKKLNTQNVGVRSSVPANNAIGFRIWGQPVVIGNWLVEKNSDTVLGSGYGQGLYRIYTPK